MHVSRGCYLDVLELAVLCVIINFIFILHFNTRYCLNQLMISTADQLGRTISINSVVLRENKLLLAGLRPSP